MVSDTRSEESMENPNTEGFSVANTPNILLTEKDGGDPDRDPTSSNKSCRNSFWKGQYCCVPSHCNASGGSEERRLLGSGRVSFYSFPSLSTDKEKAKEWIFKCDKFMEN